MERRRQLKERHIGEWSEPNHQSSGAGYREGGAEDDRYFQLDTVRCALVIFIGNVARKVVCSKPEQMWKAVDENWDLPMCSEQVAL